VDDAMKHLKLGLGEVVLGDRDVGLANYAAGPRRLHAHEGLVRVSARMNELGGGVTVHGPVHLVLYGGEELLRQLAVRLVVDTGCVDVEHLLVETPLGRADVANPLDRKSTRLNSSHVKISYAVFCLKK